MTKRAKRPTATTVALLASGVAVVLIAVTGGLVFVAKHDAEPGSDRGSVESKESTAEAEQPEFASKVEEGEHLYATVGCEGCHGPEGEGGVENANYIRDEVPALELMAERLMLYDREDAQKAVKLLEAGQEEEVRDEPPFPRYGTFMAQLNAVKGVIRNGNPAAKKDPNGPEPPLQMPSWKGQLDDQEMEAIIAYLITEYPWKEEEEEQPETASAEVSTFP